MTPYRAFSSMCEIVNAYPPRGMAAVSVAAQVRDTGCVIAASPARPVLRSIGSLACEIGSEFGIPGTQHVIERACKTVLGTAR